MMKLAPIDWSLIIGYFILALGIGLYYSRRASKGIDQYFISGRSLPWWIAGTSMVATTFAADTPLAVTGMVAKNGIAGNWLWWNFLFSAMLTTFFFARLWRRAEVLTDVEFTELRYSGKPAAVLRGFRALYLAIPINCIIMGWVTLAMAKVISLTLGWPKWEAIAICLGVALIYSVLSGFWGVVMTDFIQFIMAMSGSIALAIISIQKAGGIVGLQEKLAATYGTSSTSILSFFPGINSAWMPITIFLVYISVQWWASWYPGAEPGGGGYTAQRMFATKDERNSLLSSLWFNIAHYALRPWPWILVALAAMVFFPNLADPEIGYPKMMLAFLPIGLKGLMIAAFFAAFMSTIDTQLNWGASYLVNDFYKRFIKKDASDRHYVAISRISVIALMAIGGVITYYMSSVEGAWKFLLALGAGTGAVYILRWYWWRINAWSEISAMSAAFVTAISLQTFTSMDFAPRLLLTTVISSAIWLTVTFLTSPEKEEHLIKFYKKVRPGGRLWKHIAQKIEGIKIEQNIGSDFICWIAGCICGYASLFGIGKIILQNYLQGFIYIAAAMLSGYYIYRNLSKSLPIGSSGRVRSG
jgi:SSS family solute:Na+ symporter